MVFQSEVLVASEFSQFVPWMIVFGGLAFLAFILDVGSGIAGFRRWVDRRLVDVVGVAAAVDAQVDKLTVPHSEFEAIRGELRYLKSSLPSFESEVNQRLSAVSGDVQRREIALSSLEASRTQLEAFATETCQTAANLESVQQIAANGLAQLQSQFRSQSEKAFGDAVPSTVGNSSLIQSSSSRSNRVSGGVTVTIQTPPRVLADGTRVDPTSVTILDAARLEVSDSSVLNPNRLFEDPVQADRVVTIDTASTLNDEGAVIGGTHVRVVDPVQVDMSRPEEVQPFDQGVLDWQRDQNR
jgi:hypothetical protein